MRRLPVVVLAAITMTGALAGGASVQPPHKPPGMRGTIKGHVRLNGKPPGNVVIRMGMDPMCVKMNAGKRVVQETVAAAVDGSLANVFVTVAGKFAPAPVPTSAVLIDQRGCVYTPRVVGLRLGQTLQVNNSDTLLHNVHALSARSNGFNASQPKAGVVLQQVPKEEEIMLRLKCDIHSWMTAYIGVVAHPYFAVTGSTGTFEIPDVPVGTREVQFWHEQYGVLSKRVEVKAGATTTIDLAYSPAEKKASLREVRDLVLSDFGDTSIQVVRTAPASN